MVNEKLKYARYEAEYTQDAIAKMADISKRQYQNIENGVRNPSTPVMFEIARILNKSVDELFGHLYPPNE